MADMHDLWDKFIEGDDRVLSSLYDHYYPEIYKRAIYVLKDRDSAINVVQDSFLKIWSRRPLLTDIENPEAYLFRIARNCSLDLLKKHAQQFVELQGQEDSASSLYSDSDLSYRETEKRLQHSLARLTGRQKQIYSLSREEGYTYNDIGNQLNLSPTTVKKHMANILQKLRRHLGSTGTILITAICFHFN
jgi:RNA polymerase sigma-70 factor (family 1)